MGDWRVGKEGITDTVEIAKAVAASCAVPGLFSPVRFKTKNYFSNLQDTEYIDLVDAGVYDNQGIHSLTSNFKKSENSKSPFTPPSYIIVSDASKPFNNNHVTSNHIFYKNLWRTNEIMMYRIKNLQKNDLVRGIHSLNGIKSTFFSIDWNVKKCIRQAVDNFNKLPPYKKVFSKIKDHTTPEDAEEIFKLNNNEEPIPKERINTISTIETRLKALSKEDINFLIKHGKDLCETQIKIYMPELIDAATTPEASRVTHISQPYFSAQSLANAKTEIANGRLKEALNILIKQQPDDKTLLHLQYRDSVLSHQVNRDLILFTEANLERNKVTEALINYIFTHEK